MDRPHCKLAGNSSQPLPALRRTTLQHLLATNESCYRQHNNESSTQRLSVCKFQSHEHSQTQQNKMEHKRKTITREILMPYFQAKQIPDCGTAEQPIQPVETNNLQSTFLRFPTKIEALVVADATPSQTKTPRTPICEIAGVVVANYKETTSRYKCVCNGTENRCCCRQSPTIPRHGGTQLRHNRLGLRMRNNTSEHLLVTNDGDNASGNGVRLSLFVVSPQCRDTLAKKIADTHRQRGC